MMLVVDEQKLVAGARIREADAAGVSGLAVIGNAAHSAARRELFVGQRKKRREILGREAGDAKAHDPSLHWALVTNLGRSRRRRAPLLAGNSVFARVPQSQRRTRAA